MRYVLITETGEHQVPGGAERWLQDLGTTEPTRVPLGPLPDDLPPVTGWVNPAGPPTYAVNTIGGQLLVALGAAQADYHGPVVITGWDETAEEVGVMNSNQAWAIEQALTTPPATP